MIVWIVNPYTAGDGFKLCPQILWYSFLQEVELNSSPFECGDLVTHFQWIAYVDMMVYKFIKSIATSAFLSWVTHPRRRQHNGMKTHQAPCGKAYMEGNWGYLLTTMWVSHLVYRSPSSSQVFRFVQPHWNLDYNVMSDSKPLSSINPSWIPDS